MSVPAFKVICFLGYYITFQLSSNIPIETSNFGIRVGTRFALNEDKVSYLQAVRRRVWTCVRGHRPSLGWRHREMLELAAQALSTSNDIIFNLLVIFLPKHGNLEPAFSQRQVTRLILLGTSSAHDV